MSIDIPTDPEEDVPDWLQSLGENGAGDDLGSSEDLSGSKGPPGSKEPPGSIEPGLEGDDSPDWMSGIQDAGGQEEPDSDADWLESIREAEGTSAPAEADQGGDQDWLENVREQHISDTGGLELPQEQEDGDFMDRIQAMQAEEQGEADTGPDWMAGLQDELTPTPDTDWAQEPEPSGDEDSPDWLRGVTGPSETLEWQDEDAGSVTPVPMAAEPSTPVGGEVAPWEDGGAEDASTMNLTGDGAAPWEGGQADDAGTLAAGAGGVAPWEGDAVDDSAFAAPAAEPVAEEAAGDDWLASLGGEDTSQDMAPAAEAVGEGEDWLAGLGGEDTSQDMAPAAEESGEGDDWMSAIGGQEEAEAPAAEAEAEAPKTTGWLEDLSGDVREDGQPWGTGSLDPSLAPEKPAEGADWLSSIVGDDLVGEGADWLSDIAAQEQAADPDLPHHKAFDTGALKMIQEGREEELLAASDDVDAQFPGLPGEPGAGGPSWLADMEESSPIDDSVEMPVYDTTSAGAFTAAPAAEDFTLEPVDLPDWLSESRPEPAAEEAPAAGEVPDLDAIAPSQLPSWLESMRPVESVAPVDLPEEEEGYGVQESVGPLAGLSNVLPAEPDIVHFGGKAPEQISGLNISPAQKKQIEMLNSLIGEEEEAVPVQRRGVALPQQALRWAIAAALYLVILVPVVLGVLNVAPPTNVPAETQQMFNTIEHLQSNLPVLVAFEYQPGLSSEMEAASAGVIGHLLQKQMQLVFISTNSTGPGVIEQYLRTTGMDAYPYIADRSYPNLGFISGGTAALLNFASNPRGAIPMPLEGGGSAWEQSPLDRIHSINDFAMVLVITDDPDNARGWIEQVEPELGIGTPMVMAVSAQAEPLVYPYYSPSGDGQVTALVSGLSGGAVYESLVGGDEARSLWSGYSWGMSVTVAFAAVAGLINLVRAWMASGRERKRG